ncbi:MAG: SDR family oxidoreductase [Chromatiales bacterium]|jgi:2'-hydroxyisoflavone reductase|nr:SDR family oxidoreductase [Chromatiales bacterium]
MMRRRFIGAGLATIATAMSPRLILGRAARSLRILVLGGTGFLGPHTVRAALERGHSVTLFNRGKTRPELFPELEKLRGDRDGDLGALAGRSWDAVIDTSAYVPRIVRQSADLLRDSVERYLFVSTISVYASLARAGIDETAAVGTLPDPAVEQVDAETYGPLKALCEGVVSEVFSERGTIVRPGLLVGPGDPTDRFTYWPVRVAAGGKVLAPGDGLDPVQFIDARDLALWLVYCLEAGFGGTFNANSPQGFANMRTLLETCRDVANAETDIVWASQEFLDSHEVQPWSDLPLWVPRDGEYAAASDVSVGRAEAAGLKVRPLVKTVADTLSWFRADRRGDPELRAGMSPKRQAELLALLAAGKKG